MRSPALALAPLLLLLLLDGAAAYSEVYELDGRTWEKTSHGDWLLEFYAPWCAHCKKLAPTYEKVADHFHRAKNARVRVGKVDATAHPGIAEPFDIKGYPTLILLRDGKRVADYQGPRTFESIRDFVNDATDGKRAKAAASAARSVGDAPKARGSLAEELARKVGLRPSTQRVFSLAMLRGHNPLYFGLCMTGVGTVCCLGMMLFLCATTRATPRR